MKDSAYVYQVQDGTLSRTDGILPVLDVIDKRTLLSQIGLNIKHIHGQDAYFSHLADNAVLLDPRAIEGIIDQVIFIMAHDPSVSEMHMNTLNRLSVSVMDPTFIDYLDESAKACLEARIERQLERADFIPDEHILNALKGNEEHYTVMLHCMAPHTRSEFHSRLMAQVADQQRWYDRESARMKAIEGHLQQAKASLKALRAEQYPVHGLQRDLDRLITDRRALYKPPDGKRLQQLYKGLGEYRFAAVECTRFSMVERLKSGLHAYNPVYSERLVTYRLVEPFSAFRQRKKLIFSDE